MHVLLGLAWMVYCVLHSWLAATKVKQRAAVWMGAHFKWYRIAYTLFSFAGLIVMVLWMIRMDTFRFWERKFFVEMTGWVITISGLLLMFMCIKKYFFSLSGLKTLVKETSTQELMLSGIHRYVRHPLYLGTFIFLWGLLLVFPVGSLLVSNLIITFYTLVGIRLEEAKLLKEFGASYASYQKEVPMLLPKLSRKGNRMRITPQSGHSPITGGNNGR